MEGSSGTNEGSDELKKTSCCSLTLGDHDDAAFPLVSLRPSLKRLSRTPKYQCGYDCEFLTPPSPSLIQSDCSVCLLVLRHPHLISCCGQNYCQQCIQQVLNEGRPCPLCNSHPFTVLHNKGLERSLAQLQVRCSNQKQRCAWTGGLRDFEEHLNLNPEPDKQLSGCKYVELECVYVCGGWFHRGAIAKHQVERCPQRPFCCDYCRDYTSVHADVVYKHWLECRCYPMDCPNHCSVYAIERKDMEEHLELICPLKVVECEFRSAGCDQMAARQDMDDHLEEFHLQHTSMLAASNQKLQEELFDRDEQLAKLKEESRTEVARLQEESLQKTDTLWLENAFLKQEISQLRSEMADMKKLFMDSLSGHKERQEQREEEARGKHESLEAELAAVKSDFVDSKHSLFQQCYAIQSYVGVFPVEFLMPQYSQHLQEDREWQSPAFYSHLEGYRLCLVVNPRRCKGSGKGSDCESYVSVFACVMRGEYDWRLKWPLHVEITVQLRNQLVDRHHATGVIRFSDMTPTRYSSRVEEGEERGEKGWGLKEFIGHSELNYNSVKNRQYLKEDQLCFKIIRVISSSL